MDNLEVLTKSMDLFGNSVDLVTKKMDNITKIVKWTCTTVIVISLMFSLTFGIVACKYLDKAFSYSQVEQEVQSNNGNLKQSIK